MNYQIDQSGKIEDTARDTILCFSNDEWYAVIIKANTKRLLQEDFRAIGQTRNFITFTFSAGLAVLLKFLTHVSMITVDQEYMGKEAIVTKLVLEMLGGRKNLPEFRFGRIGKKALAHHRAYAVGLKKLSAHHTISYEELIRTLKKTEVLGTEERLSLRSKRSGSASTRSERSISHGEKKSRRKP